MQSAQYLAALESRGHDIAFQQLAVSHAAHNALTWIFHGTRNYAAVDAALKSVLGSIGLDDKSDSGEAAVKIGRRAAAAILLSRSDDGNNNFLDYVFAPALPGVYQATPGGAPLPDTPQAQFVKLFGGIQNATKFLDNVPPPPNITDKNYQDYVLYVKAQGQRNSTVRTAYDTDTAYFWRESSPT